MRVLLACAGGFSTSLLVDRMRTASEKQGKGYQIDAIAAENLENHIDDYDVVLLGPQIRHLLSKYEAIAKKHNVPLDVIGLKDYGAVDGNVVLSFAEQVYQKKEDE